jgi:hypothetical protein
MRLWHWKCGSSRRTPAFQAPRLEFKPQSHREIRDSGRTERETERKRERENVPNLFQANSSKSTPLSSLFCAPRVDIWALALRLGDVFAQREAQKSGRRKAGGRAETLPQSLSSSQVPPALAIHLLSPFLPKVSSWTFTPGSPAHAF